MGSNDTFFKIIAPIGFFGSLISLPLGVFAYIRDINKGLDPNLSYLIILVLICSIGGSLCFLIMKHYGWFSKKK